jgi:phenylalanyl-tRNA synthetase beta chain
MRVGSPARLVLASPGPEAGCRMKISVEWLKDYVNVPASLAKMRQDLTMAGLVVEALTGEPDAPVFEFEITSNRPDCLCYVGIAREISALYRKRRKPVDTTTGLHLETERIPFDVEIRDADLCPRYMGLVLDGIRVAPSPPWMQRRLELSGMRSVNNIVDITNYVLLELGHPLHAFDFDRLRGGRIVVARAEAGQKMTTLDGIERTLDAEMLLINDGAGPVAIAGIMGGQNSEIGEETTRVLLECAYFQPASVRRASKRLGLSTEASYRFERGADWEGTLAAISRTAYLIQELAGGRIAGSLRDAYPAPIPPVEIELSRSRAESLLGVRLKPSFIEATLKRLEFQPVRTGSGRWNVKCPTYRADMELEADLVEEIARFYGYENIPTTVPAGTNVGEAAPGSAYEREMRRILLGFGYSENINLSFASEFDHRTFPVTAGTTLQIRNPLTEDTQYMRSALAPGLLRAARHNFNHDQPLVRVYEIGKVFHVDGMGGVVERNALGILGTGTLAPPSWLGPSSEFGIFQMKGTVTALLERMRCAAAEVVPVGDVPWLEEATAAALMVGGQRLGVLGRLHPRLEEELKLKQPVVVAEIELDGLYPHLFAPVCFEPLPRYPSVERDISFVVTQEVRYSELRQGILALGIRELQALDLIDVYEGGKIAGDHVSLTLRLTFQDREATLTIDRVQAFSDNIRSYLRGHFGAEFR